MKIVSTEEMQAIEQACVKEGVSLASLMENAGKAVASCVKKKQERSGRFSVLVLAGGGNNGGDGLVAARYLNEWGFRVRFYLLKERNLKDENYKKVLEQGIEVVTADKDKGYETLCGMLSKSHAVIDAVLGTGANRKLEGTVKEIAQIINEEKGKTPSLNIYAIDVPTGLNATSGEYDPSCIKADYTIALGLLKEGYYASTTSAEAIGQLTHADIGIPEKLSTHVKTELLTREKAKTMPPLRFPASNKGSYGKVMVIAGSASFSGAACLAGEAAIRAGAGLVTLAAAKSLHPILASNVLEATHLLLPEESYGVVAKDADSVVSKELEPYNTMLLGCGVSCAESVKEFVKRLLFNAELSTKKIVLDADALNILSGIDNWWQRLPYNAILTPHPGEMARLTGLSVSEIQSNRLNIAREYAKRWNKTIILKGACTAVASPSGKVAVSGEMIPALSTAGTGDVLAGTVAGFAAQGLNLYKAACLGVYLHTQAGLKASQKIGDAGMLASELLPELPKVLKELKCS